MSVCIKLIYEARIATSCMLVVLQSQGAVAEKLAKLSNDSEQDKLGN